MSSGMIGSQISPIVGHRIQRGRALTAASVQYPTVELHPLLRRLLVGDGLDASRPVLIPVPLGNSVLVFPPPGQSAINVGWCLVTSLVPG